MDTVCLDEHCLDMDPEQTARAPITTTGSTPSPPLLSSAVAWRFFCSNHLRRVQLSWWAPPPGIQLSSVSNPNSSEVSSEAISGVVESSVAVADQSATR
ncbi:hypothetical protein Bca4012_011757 [Brassica carinata]